MAAMEQMNTLGLVQFLAAVHIFMNQIYNLRIGYFPTYVFPQWAPTWYTFLFAVEGFRATYEQLKGPSPDDMGPILPYLCRQAARLYPAHLLSVALLAATPNAVYWGTAYVNVLPIFTWYGTTADGWHRAWNGGAWHVSDLALHLVCWRFVYPKLMSLPERSCWHLLGASLLVSYLRVLGSALGFVTRIVMWAPYTFSHFLCGMCLAKLFVARDTNHGALRDTVMLEVWPYRYPASGMLAVAALFFIFWYSPQPDDIHAVAPYAPWLGVLMPFHLLLIWMLALEEGPLAQLCRRRPFCWAGDLSYAMFVLHWNGVVCTARFGHTLHLTGLTGKMKFAAIILPATAALAALAHLVVERPLRRWARKPQDLKKE